MERLLYEDPEELRGILAVRLRELRERDIEEIPRLLERIQAILTGMQVQLDKAKESLLPDFRGPQSPATDPYPRPEDASDDTSAD